MMGGGIFFGDLLIDDLAENINDQAVIGSHRRRCTNFALVKA
tara:strand:- start:910 stop:1035 length:126 start_codon:yes stop_codon:yes gene_type:complete